MDHAIFRTGLSAGWLTVHLILTKVCCVNEIAGCGRHLKPAGRPRPDVVGDFHQECGGVALNNGHINQSTMNF